MTTIIPFRSRTPTRGADRLSTLPFSWDAADASLDALSGQVGTLVRATAGGAMLDSLGLMQHAVHSQARWEAVLDPVFGGTRLGLLLEPARTNLVLRSEELDDAAWSDIGTPVVTAAQRTAGALVLDLVEDDAAGTLEGRSQEVTFTGNAAKYVLFHVAEGTSTSTVVRLRDTTAGANRLLLAVTWSAGVPAVTMTTGTLIGTRALANGVYEVRVQTTSVTAANTNVLELYPATDAALSATPTGTVYLGGIAAFNRLGALSYSKNAGSAVALNAEQLSWPFAVPRRRVWMYLAFIELGGRYSTSTAGLAVVGEIGNCGFGLYPGLSAYTAFHYANGSGDLSLIASTHAYPSHVRLVELLATQAADGTPSITVAYDGVEQGTTSGLVAPANMTEDYTGGTVKLGAWNATTILGGEAYLALKLGEYGLGTPTLARARGYR